MDRMFYLLIIYLCLVSVPVSMNDDDIIVRTRTGSESGDQSNESNPESSSEKNENSLTFASSSSRPVRKFHSKGYKAQEKGVKEIKTKEKLFELTKTDVEYIYLYLDIEKCNKPVSNVHEFYSCIKNGVDKKLETEYEMIQKEIKSIKVKHMEDVMNLKREVSDLLYKQQVADKEAEYNKEKLKNIISKYVNNLNSVKKDLEDRKNELEDKKQEFSNDLDKAKKENANLKIDLQNSNIKIKELEKTIENLKTKSAKNDKTINSLKQTITSFNEKLKNEEQESKTEFTKELEEEISCLKNQVEKLNLDKKSFEEKETELRNEFENIEQISIEKQKVIKDLEEVHSNKIKQIKQKLANKLNNFIKKEIMDIETDEDEQNEDNFDTISPSSSPESLSNKLKKMFKRKVSFNGWGSINGKSLQSKYNYNTNQMDVFVACDSQENARNAALNHGDSGYYNDPILDPIHNKDNPLEFCHFHLGRDNNRMIVMHGGVAYNYHYYFGTNSHGMIARQEEGCDEPNPNYY